jgi:hypothetical protein
VSGKEALIQRVYVVDLDATNGGSVLHEFLLLGAHTFRAALDDDDPGDSGRRSGLPDETDLIRIAFEQPLSSGSTAP